MRETAAAVGAAVFGDVASEDTARRLIKKLAAAGLAGPAGRDLAAADNVCRYFDDGPGR